MTLDQMERLLRLRERARRTKGRKMVVSEDDWLFLEAAIRELSGPHPLHSDADGDILFKGMGLVIEEDADDK